MLTDKAYILSRLHLQIGKHTGVPRSQHKVISHDFGDDGKTINNNHVVVINEEGFELL